MTLHVGKDCPVSLMQSCVELHQTPVQFRRNLQESSETPVSTNCTTCDPYGFFPSKQSFSRLRSFGGSPNMYSKPALVWSPAPDPHGKSSGNTSSTRPGSPSSGLVHWMSMMADHNHDVHYMWNGVETKMNTSDQHATPPLQKGPVSGLDDNRTSSIEPSQIHGIYGNHGNRTSSSGSPPVSTPSSSGSMVVVPQPINAIAKGPALGSASTNGTGRKYQCKMCPQIFMHKSAMQHHAREVHRGDLKPHQCQQCLKSFSSNHQLTQHIRIHTGEKPYKCSYCDRRFKQLSHVQQHTRLHTGERPYKCHLPDCGRAFIQLSNLQQHLRNHDSQMERAKNRPFHCNICGKGFASESSLRTHRSKQHAALIGGANSQSCPVCHKICLNGEALMEHMRSTHKDPNASGTPSKRKRARSNRARNSSTSSIGISTTTSMVTPIHSPSPSSPPTSSPASRTSIISTSNAVSLTAPLHSSYASALSGNAGSLMSTMGMGMGHFMVPPVVGAAGPHSLAAHPAGHAQNHHYPHHPLASRAQHSFLSL